MRRTFHQKFDPGNRRWHGRLVEVALLAQGVALAVEEAEAVLGFVTSAIQGHELVASLGVVVPLEGIHLVGVLEGNGQRYLF